MRIFITGASGFIGGAIVERLRERHTFVGMSRSERSDGVIEGLGAEPRRCSLRNVSPKDLEGCDAVVHAAAFVEAWGTRAQFFDANVTGTRRVLEAAQATGVRRFVHIGTEAAVFDGHPLVDIDETYPYPKTTPFLYSETKAEAERLVLAANGGSFTTVSLRPRLVWGPGDQTILPTLVEMVASGRFSWIGKGAARTSTTNVYNLVAAVDRALVAGVGGQAYFITDDETTTLRAFLGELLATRGLVPADKSIPPVVARAVAWAVEGIWKALRLSSEPPVTRFAASMMGVECTLRIDKARRELGYAPVLSVREGLAALAPARTAVAARELSPVGVAS